MIKVPKDNNPESIKEIIDLRLNIVLKFKNKKEVFILLLKK